MQVGNVCWPRPHLTAACPCLQVDGNFSLFGHPVGFGGGVVFLRTPFHLKYIATETLTVTRNSTKIVPVL